MLFSPHYDHRFNDALLVVHSAGYFQKPYQAFDSAARLCTGSTSGRRGQQGIKGRTRPDFRISKPETAGTPKNGQVPRHGRRKPQAGIRIGELALQSSLSIGRAARISSLPK